jgi:hypothetical protein
LLILKYFYTLTWKLPIHGDKCNMVALGLPVTSAVFKFFDR